METLKVRGSVSNCFLVEIGFIPGMMGTLMPASRQSATNLKKLYKNFSDLILEQEITRYTFEIDVYFNEKPEIILKKLDTICNKYESIFKYKPLK